jgi:hypothetical protein
MSLGKRAAERAFVLFPFIRRNSGGGNWRLVLLDKMYLETQTERYFIVLRTPDGCKSVFLSLDEIPADTDGKNLFRQSNTLSRVLCKLGVKVVSVRLLQRTNAPGAAVCTMRQGITTRRVPLDLLEAVRISFEHNLPIEVPVKLLQPGRFDFDGFMPFRETRDCLFTPKFIERDDVNHCNEVIM